MLRALAQPHDERHPTTAVTRKSSVTTLQPSDFSGHKIVPPQLPPATVAFRYSVYSYGGGGGSARKTGSKTGTTGSKIGTSRARESIRACASSFVDLYAAGHGESVERIREDRVDILVDLQGHTLGGRSEIAAARPARLQVRGVAAAAPATPR